MTLPIVLPSFIVGITMDIKIEAMRNGRLIEVPIVYGVRITKPKLNTWEDGFHNLFELFIKYVNK